MNEEPTPEEVLNSTTPEIRNLIAEILKLESEYQNYQDLSQLKNRENELCQRIGRLIEREVKE